MTERIIAHETAAIHNPRSSILDPRMHFTSLTRHAGIGANSYLLECDGARVVLDAGLDPKQEGSAAIPMFEDLEFDSLDAMILSHAHLDHAGTVPVLMRDQPSMPVYLTPATAKLAKAMLHNSVNVMQSKRVELGIQEYPLFGHRELDRAGRRREDPVRVPTLGVLADRGAPDEGADLEVEPSVLRDSGNGLDVGDDRAGGRVRPDRQRALDDLASQRQDGVVGPRTRTGKTEIRCIDSEFHHQMEQLDLLSDWRIRYRRVLQTVTERLIIEFDAESGERRRPRHQVPIVD